MFHNRAPGTPPLPSSLPFSFSLWLFYFFLFFSPLASHPPTPLLLLHFFFFFFFLFSHLLALFFCSPWLSVCLSHARTHKTSRPPTPPPPPPLLFLHACPPPPPPSRPPCLPPLAGCCCWLTVLIYSRSGRLPAHLKQLHELQGPAGGAKFGWQ